MLKTLALLVLGFSLTATAKDMKLTCTAQRNLDLVVSEEISLAPGAKNIVFGDFEEFRFYVTDKGSDIIEVQAYNGAESSRTYATGKLTAEGDFVEASVWNRELILDVRCTR